MASGIHRDTSRMLFMLYIVLHERPEPSYVNTLQLPNKKNQIKVYSSLKSHRVSHTCTMYIHMCVEKPIKHH